MCLGSVSFAPPENGANVKQADLASSGVASLRNAAARADPAQRAPARGRAGRRARAAVLPAPAGGARGGADLRGAGAAEPRARPGGGGRAGAVAGGDADLLALAGERVLGRIPPLRRARRRDAA